MAIYGKVQSRVKSFFTPAAFDPLGFRGSIQTALLGLMFGEMTTYIVLKQSAQTGELPNYVTDILIISISALEFLLGPLIGWLGMLRRRNFMVGFVAVALVCVLPLFGLPKPEVDYDTALCNVDSLPVESSPMSAVWLSILILVALSSALARLALTAHALAYLDEYNPSHNLHLNVAVLTLVRVVVLLIGTTMLDTVMVRMPWLKYLIIVTQLSIGIIKLMKVPVAPPKIEGQESGDRGFSRSLSRVLQSKMAVLQILAMSLLAAALWGFGSQEDNFAKFKYHAAVVLGTDLIWKGMAVLRALFIIIGVILAGYMYTDPVMPSLDKKKAIGNSARMAVYCVIFFVLMTAALNCSKGEVVGLGDTQPTCSQGCGCDHAWPEFDPVCVSDQITFYSPCHAGCASSSSNGNLMVYTNCSCSPTGQAAIGACGDHSCFAAYTLHTLMFTAIVLAGTLAFVWQLTVMLEAVDRRDKSVALGLASGTVSFFAFVGAHGLYAWFGASTCAQFQGEVCLFQTSEFVPRVGYTSTGLAGASFLVAMVAYVIQHRQTKKEVEQKRLENEDLSRS